MSGSATVLPPAVVLPVSAFAIIVIAAHLVVLHGAARVPLSRVRIRTANGVVMIITVMSLAYAFGMAPVGDIRAFTLAWATAVMLVTLVLALGALDVANNLRLVRTKRQRIRRDAADLHVQLAQMLGRARGSPGTETNDASPPTPRHSGDDAERGE